MPESKGGIVGVPDGADQLYLEVIKPTCRLCHLTRRLGGRYPINFGYYSGFMLYQKEIESTIYDEGSMPLALRTFNHFWQTGQSDILASHLPGFSRYEPGTTEVLKPGRPIANAGPTPRVGNRVVEFAPADPAKVVMLNGKASLFATNFNWTLDPLQSASTNIQLTNANTATPTFKPDVAGDYTFTLTVDNGVAGQTSSSSITVTAVQNPALVSFSNDLAPQTTLPSGYFGGGPLGPCTECHGRNENRIDEKFGKFAGYDFAPSMAFRVIGPEAYNNFIDRINFDKPQESLILEYPSTMKHDGGLPFYGYGEDVPGGTPDYVYYDLILQWILEGAQNN